MPMIPRAWGVIISHLSPHFAAGPINVTIGQEGHQRDDLHPEAAGHVRQEARQAQGGSQGTIS